MCITKINLLIKLNKYFSVDKKLTSTRFINKLFHQVLSNINLLIKFYSQFSQDQLILLFNK